MLMMIDQTSQAIIEFVDQCHFHCRIYKCQVRVQVTHNDLDFQEFLFASPARDWIFDFVNLGGGSKLTSVFNVARSYTEQ